MTKPSAPVAQASLLSRREVLKYAAAGGVALAAASMPDICGAQANQSPLRVVAYNVYECTGWPKDRSLANKATKLGQMPARFAHELALYEPDIINFSESPDEAVVRDIAERLGMNYVRFPSGGKWPGTLLSRFEIADARNVPLVEGQRPADLFTRHWGQATVKLPGGESLVVHSAHLYPGPDPELRLREIPRMIESMQQDLDAGRSMLLIGDLNHRPDTEEYRQWIDAGWVDTFAKVGAGEGLTIPADKPQSRIDYILAAGPIAERVVSSKPLFEGAFRTNPDDPTSFALSDHLPQLAVFQ